MADTNSKWQKRVARWRASGETAEVFCAREGFAANTLRWWSSKLAREKESSSSIGMVQLVRATAPPARASDGAVVIDLVEARARITVAADVEAATLKTVLAAFGVGGAV